MTLTLAEMLKIIEEGIALGHLERLPDGRIRITELGMVAMCDGAEA